MKKVIFTLIIAYSTTLYGQGSWQQIQDFHVAFMDGVCFSIGNKAYIGLISTSSGSAGMTNSFWQFDGTSWSQIADFGGGIRTSATAFAIGNLGYVGTGMDEFSNMHNDFWEYDPNLNVWTSKADYPGIGRASMVGMSIGNKGYLGLGGITSPDFWEYDPVTDSWNQKANLFQLSDGIAFSIGQRGYVGTGNKSMGITAQFWEYNPTLDTWTQMADFGGGARNNASACSIGSYGYVMNGYTGSTSTREIWDYNPLTNNWTQQAIFPGLPRVAGIGFSCGNKIYFGGGVEAQIFWYKDFWEFTPCFGSAQITASGPTTICNGESITLTASTGTNYLWNTGETTQSITVSSAGTYAVTVESCLSPSITIAVLPLPYVNINSGNSYLCNGSSLNLEISNPDPTYQYQWSTGETTESISVNLPGSYSVTATDLNGCDITTNAIVNDFPNCEGFLEISSDPIVNYFDTINVQVKIKGGVDIFSVYSKIGFQSNELMLVESTPGNYLGANIITNPPIVSGDSIDFGITKITGQSGSNGDGLIFSFKFVLKILPNLVFDPVYPASTTTLFNLANISVYNSFGIEAASFNSISDNVSETIIRYYVPVWPGDLNNDYMCNVADILPIGYFYNAVGPIRPGGSLQWFAQPAELWGFDKTAINSSAYQTFADANADGQVDLADQSAIGFNLNSIHFRLGISGTEYLNRIQNPNLPSLSVSIPHDSILFPYRITAEIRGGTNSVPINDLYGLAFDLYFNSGCVNTNDIIVNFTQAFGNIGTDYIKIIDNSGVNQGRLSIGITRINNTPSIELDGDLICTVEFPLHPNCNESPCFKVVPQILSCNQQDGERVVLNAIGDSIVTCLISVPEYSDQFTFNVYPNPVLHDQVLKIKFSTSPQVVIISDVQGREISRYNTIEITHENELYIPIKRLTSGYYTLSFLKDSRILGVKPFVVTRQ